MMLLHKQSRESRLIWLSFYFNHGVNDDDDDDDEVDDDDDDDARGFSDTKLCLPDFENPTIYTNFLLNYLSMKQNLIELGKLALPTVKKTHP